MEGNSSCLFLPPKVPKGHGDLGTSVCLCWSLECKPASSVCLALLLCCQGLNKVVAEQTYGQEVVAKWRRSHDTAPEGESLRVWHLLSTESAHKRF